MPEYLVLPNNTKMNKMTKWVVFISVVLFLISIVSSMWTYSWVSKAEAVEGQVIELVKKNEDDTRSTYAPRVAYRINGKQREFVSKWSSNPPSFAVGDRVTVLVSSNRAHEAVASAIGLYGVPIFATAALIALAFAAIVLQNGDRILRILHPQLR